MKTSERRKLILSQINHSGEVNVDRLIREYNVSVETIRRDLRYLDDQGFVKRIYGGAVKAEKLIPQPPYSDRLLYNQDKKEAIAREAVHLLENGDSIFIDGKTTCLAFTRHIPETMELTIVTNSLSVADYLLKHKKKCTVFITGGELNEEGFATGPRINQEVKGYRFEKTFFSPVALDATGCYYSRTELPQLLRSLAEVSAQMVMLADSSKVNKVAFMFGLGLDDVDWIVTDEQVPAEFVRDMKGRSCQLRIAPLSPPAEQL